MTTYDRRNSSDRYISVVVVIGIIVLILSGVMAKAQRAPHYKIVNGQVTTVTDSGKAAKPSVIYQKIGNDTFYVGSKGGVYYLRTSKEKGKTYKVYVK